MENLVKHVYFKSWDKALEIIRGKDSSVDTVEKARQYLLTSGNYYYYSISFIEESSDIFTHGKHYDCSTFNGADINNLLEEVVNINIIDNDSPKDIIAKMLYIIKSNSEDISKLKDEKVDRSEILNFATIDNVREMIKEAVDWHLGCWDDPGNTEPEEPNTDDSVGSIDTNKIISINENLLSSGTYTLRYIDENDSIIDSFKPITSFTI